MPRTYAIDLGSTNTVVASARDQGEPELLSAHRLSRRRPGGPPLIPSVIYVRNAAAVDVVVGDEVRRLGLDDRDDPRYIRGFKRRIAAEVQGLNPELDGVEVTPERAAGWFLTTVLQRLPELDRDRDRVVFTVPVGSFQRYLAWLDTFWPVRHWRVVDESTAAAVGYGVAGPGRRVLTVDLGGGTIDLSLVRLPASLDADGPPLIATVIAKASQVLGGDDIDAWLLDHVLAGLAVDPEQVRAHRGALLLAAELAKIRLSDRASTVFRANAGGVSHRATVTRDDLETVLIRNDFLSRLHSAVESVLRQAERKGVGSADIEHVLLVGGTGQIPAVRRALQQVFGAARVCSEHVFTAAALGAARLASGIEVRDFLYHSYAVRGWNHSSRRHEYDLVVPAMSPYPFTQPVIREYAASSPNQTAMEIFIGEIDHGDVSRPEVLLEDQRVKVVNAPSPMHRYALVEADRTVPLNNGTVVRLEPPGHPGVNRIRVEFHVDEHRRLRLTVFDLQTHRPLLLDQAVALLT